MGSNRQEVLEGNVVSCGAKEGGGTGACRSPFAHLTQGFLCAPPLDWGGGAPPLCGDRCIRLGRGDKCGQDAELAHALCGHGSSDGAVSNLGPLFTMRWPVRLWAELREGDRVGRDLADVLDRLSRGTCLASSRRSDEPGAYDCAERLRPAVRELVRPAGLEPATPRFEE